MRIGIGQFAPELDVDHNLTVIERLATEAAEQSARLLILPELSLSGWGKTGIEVEIQQPLDCPAVDRLARLADKLDLSIISGMYEQRGEGLNPYNTVIALTPGNGIVATHRKTHLMNAWGDRESDGASTGDNSVNTFLVDGSVKVGLVNCYEVRFPERAYKLALDGVDIIAVSAAWPSGPNKEEHWLLNLRARALETTTWVAGAGAIGGGCIGRSAVVDPSGVVVAQIGEDEGITTTTFDRERTEKMRSALPVLQQRRERYGTPTANEVSQW
nr:nitrilase-related carbon-nitrogen hydrolase [Rhodococcus sp. (in: high G+C Gram-positive bacteria)]